jgi:hypothetical protein
MTEDNFNAVIRAADPNATDIKTETRRLLTIKGRTQEYINEIESFHKDEDGGWVAVSGLDANNPEWVKKAYPKGSNQGIKSPLQIGDCAYLKEPTQNLASADYTNKKLHIQYFWGNPESKWVTPTEQDLIKINNRKTGIYSKQSQMFMLKSFARHSVKILDVRVERLLDITDEGAIAEGIKYQDCRDDVGYYRTWFDYTKNSYRFKDPVKSYISEIEMLHSKEIAAANPWLWVYKFRYITGE